MGKKEGGEEEGQRSCFGGEKIGTQVSLFEPREHVCVEIFKTTLGPCLWDGGHPRTPWQTPKTQRTEIDDT